MKAGKKVGRGRTGLTLEDFAKRGLHAQRAVNRVGREIKEKLAARMRREANAEMLKNEKLTAGFDALREVAHAMGREVAEKLDTKMRRGNVRDSVERVPTGKVLPHGHD